jgi:hypothetical protein
MRDTLKTFTAHGTKVEIVVWEDGSFNTRVHGEWIKEMTLAECEAKARKAAKKAAIVVSVPFTMTGVVLHKSAYRGSSWVSGYGTRDGVATGIHSGSGRTMVKWDDGTTEQLRSSREERVVRRLTAEEKAEYIEVEKAYRAAEERRYQFARKVGMSSLEEAVIAAQRASVTEDEVEEANDVVPPKRK